MNNIALTLSATLIATLAMPVAAENLTVRGSVPIEDEATIRVPYGDLKFAEAGAADALRDRVRQAVRKGCGNLYGSAFLSQEWVCRDIAWQIAAPQIADAVASAQAGRGLSAKTLVLRFARR